MSDKADVFPACQVLTLLADLANLLHLALTEGRAFAWRAVRVQGTIADCDILISIRRDQVTAYRVLDNWLAGLAPALTPGQVEPPVLTPLQATLVELADTKPDDTELLSPPWDTGFESWTDQVPKGLRPLWGSLPLEAKLVALLVGGRGISSRDI